MKKYFFMFLFLISCHAKITSNIVVDGKLFSVASCRAGQATGFSGIDLINSEGAKIRLVYSPTTHAQAYLFLPNQDTGIELGLCGPFSLEQQSSRINSIYNHRGHATLDCTLNGHSLRGNVTFENCH